MILILIALLAALLAVVAGVLCGAAKLPAWLCRIVELGVLVLAFSWLQGVL